MVDDIMLQAEERMERALASLGEAFGSVRTGRASALLLDRIKVDYYGVPTPVNQMAGIKTPDAHMLVIEPWDKGVLGAIEHAIMESDLGVTPSNDGIISAKLMEVILPLLSAKSSLLPERATETKAFRLGRSSVRSMVVCLPLVSAKFNTAPVRVTEANASGVSQQPVLQSKIRWYPIDLSPS